MSGIIVTPVVSRKMWTPCAVIDVIKINADGVNFGGLEISILKSDRAVVFQLFSGAAATLL